MRDIARAAGVCPMTVSLALRNHTRISLPTRKRIQKLAARMGYRRDPVVARLMSQLKRTRRSRRDVLAFITNLDCPFESLHGTADTSCLEGARRKAHALGYEIEEFQIHGSMTAERLSKVLWTRMIEGVLIGPLASANTPLTMDWSRFSAVAIGHTLSRPNLHRVSNNQQQSIMLAMARMHDLGYRRIGVFVPEAWDERVNHASKAGYFLACDILGIKANRAFISAAKDPPKNLEKWLAKTQPDAVISGSLTHEWLAALGCNIPGDIGFASLQVRPWETHLSGINQQWDHVGAAAVDMLINQMHTHQTGIPGNPFTLTLEGRWMEGRTARNQSKSA